MRTVGLLRKNLYTYVDDYYLICSDNPLTKKKIKKEIASIKYNIVFKKGEKFIFNPKGNGSWWYKDIYRYSYQWGLDHLYDVHREEESLEEESEE